jgi:hypothetical protein
LLAAAGTPATIVNWAGDEMVSVQEMAAFAGELLGKPARIEIAPAPGAQPGSGVDNSRRLVITGRCQVSWRDRLRRVLAQLYPGRLATDDTPLPPRA